MEHILDWFAPNSKGQVKNVKELVTSHIISTRHWGEKKNASVIFGKRQLKQYFFHYLIWRIPCVL